MAMESELPHIPAEIVDHIISTLPVKSVFRFKSVCKRWLSFLSDPNFSPSIERHRVLFSAALNSGRSSSFHSLDHDASVETLPNPWKGKLISIFGSCNGLFLINVGADLFLWNPSTGDYYRKMLTYDSLLEEDYHVISGLCYDRYNDEYKAVIGLAHQCSPNSGGEFVVVGSFKSKSKKVCFPYGTIRSANRGPVVNGKLHWWVSEVTGLGYFKAPHIIIYFDPVKNRFEKVPMPLLFGEEDTLLGLGVLGGCLCMVRRRDTKEIDFEGSSEVLAMKQYGVKESWTSLFIVSNFTLRCIRIAEVEPLCYTQDGEVLLLINKVKMLAYNPRENSRRNIRMPTNHHLIDAATYVESLVSPKPERQSRRRKRGKKTQMQTQPSKEDEIWDELLDLHI